jgi:hypothetical protein
MITTLEFPSLAEEKKHRSFWERIANEEELRDCASLEKLLAGCEIIAALDGVDLLAA